MISADACESSSNFETRQLRLGLVSGKLFDPGINVGPAQEREVPIGPHCSPEAAFDDHLRVAERCVLVLRVMLLIS